MIKKRTAKEYSKLFKDKNPDLILLEEYVNRYFPLKVKNRYTGEIYELTPDYYLTGELNKRVKRAHYKEEYGENYGRKYSFESKEIKKLLDMPMPEFSKENFTHNSKYEAYINYLLKESGITYSAEKSFDWSKHILPTGHTGRFRYDFYIPDTTLLEYDGEQHYKKNDFFKITLAEQQKRDNLKNKLAKEHGYTVYRIRTKNWKKIKKQLADILVKS